MGMTHQELMWVFISPTLAVFIVIVNLVQIYSIIKSNRRKLSIPFIFMVNLSISDLSVGLTEILIKTIYWTIYTRKISSQAILDIFNYLLFVFLRMSLMMSVFNLIAITFDRLYCVIKPIHYRQMNRRKAFYVCISLWIISIISTSSYYYGLSSLKDAYTMWRIDLLFFPLTTFPTLPFLSFVYIFIWFHVKKQNKNLQAENSDNSFVRRKKQEHRLFVLACTVVVFFILCWFPISIYSLLKLFKFDMRYDYDNILFVIAMSNSLLNPLVYFHFIRNKIWRILRRAIKTSFIGRHCCFCFAEEDFQMTPRRNFSTKTSTASMVDTVF